MDGSRKTAKILVVDDIVANLRVLRDALEPEGYELAVATDGPTALKVAATSRPDLILLDIAMPDMDGFEVCRRLQENDSVKDIPVIFITARDETDSLVEAFRVGGADYITKPFAREEVLSRVATHLRSSQLTRALVEKNEQLQQEIERRETAEQASLTAASALQTADERLDLISREANSHWDIEGFIGNSPIIAKILQEVRQLQSANASVLIEGESGTGKELIARAVHYGGIRAEGPFIALNCSAIPSELAESTLFGHVKGSFSGAVASRKGSFVLADGGTLFLDEIGDMPPLLQAKLLRVLEEGLVTPVGGEREESVDVRVVAATNANLQDRIGSGTFRKDLYFRLARFQVRLPPLRERRDDIGLLTRHFLDLFAVEMGLADPMIDDAGLQALQGYAFPGNVRELKNMIEHALIRSAGEVITPEHLYFIETTTPTAMSPPAASEASGLADRRQASLTTKESQVRVLAYVREHGSINNEECRVLLDAHYNRASYLLKKMSRDGVLLRVGERRGAFYRSA
jgi:DNA-binding NtrC family response regulator